VATPDADWKFDYWSGDIGTLVAPDSASTTITMDADKAITVNFFNPHEHPSLILGTLTLTWDIVDSTINISDTPGAGELTGDVGDSGLFFANRDGTYAGYSTSFRFDGRVTPWRD
jgi:hypothetical protein